MLSPKLPILTITCLVILYILSAWVCVYSQLHSKRNPISFIHNNFQPETKGRCVKIYLNTFIFLFYIKSLVFIKKIYNKAIIYNYHSVYAE